MLHCFEFRNFYAIFSMVYSVWLEVIFQSIGMKFCEFLVLGVPDLSLNAFYQAVNEMS